MARITIHDRLVAALQHRGEAIIADARSTRYTVLTRTRRETGEQVGFYFVGRAGALRAGRGYETPGDQAREPGIPPVPGGSAQPSFLEEVTFPIREAAL